MSDRATGAWVEKLELLLALGPPQRRSRIILGIVGLSASVAAVSGGIVAVAYASDSGERWFWTAMTLNLAIMLCVLLGEAL